MAIPSHEEQIRQKYARFQQLQQHIEQISAQVEQMNQQQEELEISKNAVAELGNTAPDEEILAPIANGIFVKAKLMDTQRFVINVGSNVTVEKSVSEVVDLLQKEQEKMTARITEASAILEQLSEQALRIYKEVEKHVQQT